MDPNLTTYSYVAVTNGVISELGSDTPPANAIQLPPGAAIYPGFIDSHSHAISFLVPTINDQNGNPFWLYVGNVNVMLQPNFTPMITQDQVINALKSAKPNGIGWVLGWNYEPSRLSCNGNQTYGFLCPNNFENANQHTALQQLDAIRSDVPMMVSSESGHIVYVNTKGLEALNLCPPSSTSTNCYKPVDNPNIEWPLSQTGQLNEDLALYAISYILTKMNDSMKTDADKLPVFRQLITSSTQKYSQLGYTTVQEGAANPAVIAAYIEVAKASPLPVRMAFLDYIQHPLNDAYKLRIAEAAALRDGLAGSDMFLAGIKLYADGSNPGITGEMASPIQYTNLNKPYTDPNIFPQQPYNGLSDLDANELSQVVQWAHAEKLPVFIHTNGNGAQTNTIAALTGNPAQGIRDVIVHFSMPTQAQVQSVAKAGNIGVTFLMNDFYYYYQPLCEQLLQPIGTANMYPAAWATAAGLPIGLHSDTSVTPPSPLFSVWVASTRSVQAPKWMPPLLSQCKANQSNQVISRLQAIKAYTSDAAWLYNRDAAGTGVTPIGSLQNQYAGDLVVFSADPLNPTTDLSTVKVLYTVHNGNVVYSDPTGSNPVVWPN